MGVNTRKGVVTMSEIKTFSLEQLKDPLRVRDRVTHKLLEEERKPNVIGLGVGGKINEGQRTGEPALMVLVTQKVADTELSSEDKVPEMVEDVKTDVLEVGVPQALIAMLPLTEGRTTREEVFMTIHDGTRMAAAPAARMAPPLPAEARLPVEMQMQGEIKQLARRIRPAQGGWGVGHYPITPRTIPTCD